LKRMKAAYPLDRKMALARIEAAKAEKQRSLSTISSDESLENQVKQAEARYKEAQVIAPTDGTILRLLAHEGELVQGKPILQMANLKEMIVVAEISVDFRPLIKEGDQAEITSKVFKEPEKEDKKEQCLGKLEGEVYTIEDMVGKPQVANPDPLAPSDKRIVQVKIKLTKKEQNALAAKYIGHEVKVKIVKPKQQKNGPK
ncbi:MAG TPA: efflux RND transporter periplasmic adaptor subunit, partial [Nitrososphaera sp.]|nr:efflux RND transporter periplasmic adaptor subunit [Nitrososphaera sp.]